MNTVYRDMQLALLRKQVTGKLFAFVDERFPLKATAVRDCGFCFCVVLLEVPYGEFAPDKPELNVPFWEFNGIMVEWRIDTDEP